MAFHTSDHPDVPSMKGLHLFHFMLSNCSQRVRLALEEKDLVWRSHHLNLPANEHLTSDYVRINPNGVVPTLVHDGQVVIESNDILRYLDEQFPAVALQPDDPGERTTMDALIDASTAFQSTIKVLSHERLFRPFRKVEPEELELYTAKHPNRDLVAFLRDYAANGSGWRERVSRAGSELERTLETLEEALRTSDWLSGSAYGLADVSWVVNANRLLQARVDLSPWPRFAAWTERCMARPAFDRAVASYRP